MEKTNWIGKQSLINLFASVEEKEKIEKLENRKAEDIKKVKTMEELISEMRDETAIRNRDNKEFYAKVERQIAEIKNTLNVVVDEQELQRIGHMNMTELMQEMLKNLESMKEKIDKIR